MVDRRHVVTAKAEQEAEEEKIASESTWSLGTRSKISVRESERSRGEEGSDAATIVSTEETSMNERRRAKRPEEGQRSRREMTETTRIPTGDGEGGGDNNSERRREESFF